MGIENIIIKREERDEQNIENISKGIEPKLCKRRVSKDGKRLETGSGMRMDEKDFENTEGTEIYTPKNINKDLLVLDRIKERIAREQGISREQLEKEMGKQRWFEYVLIQGAQHLWFGKNDIDWPGRLETTLTSDYDDITNKVDVVFELQNNEEAESEIFRLGIDGTTNEKSVHDKILSNLGKISGISGKEPMVKYFKSAFTGEKAPIETIPLVMGVKTKTIENFLFDYLASGKPIEPEEVSELLAEDTSSQEKKKKIASFLNKEREKREKGTSKRMAESPVQIFFLDEIKYQLEIYSSFLEDCIENHSSVKSRNQGLKDKPVLEERSKMIGELLGLINEILEEKTEQGIVIEGNPESDDVFRKIKETTKIDPRELLKDVENRKRTNDFSRYQRAV